MYKNIATQRLREPLHKIKGISADVLRLDQLHPVVSGNKWFKLKYYIEAAIAAGNKGIISFGGAYSNHLVALAHACREHGLKSTGIIRGEAPASPSPSLLQMQEAGMQLIFVSRTQYKEKEQIINTFAKTYPDYHIVQEGGQGPAGIRGAGEILALVPHTNYSHILLPLGTGTTLAGIANAAAPAQQVIGVSAIKVADPQDNELLQFLQQTVPAKNYTVWFNEHLGGYGKKTVELINFMNKLYRQEHLPTDFIYTGKLFLAIDKMVRNDYFAAGSSLLIIHTGGLQGNRSLPPGMLDF